MRLDGTVNWPSDNPAQPSLFIEKAGAPILDSRTLLVSQSRELWDALAASLPHGCKLSFAGTGAGALSMLASEPVQILLLDRDLPDLNSRELCQMILGSFPKLSILYREGSGGDDFRVVRDLHPESRTLLQALKHLAGIPVAGRFPASCDPAARESVAAQDAECDPAAAGSAVNELLPQVIAVSPSMRLVSRLVRLVAGRNSTVLLTGETGTGKEKIARAIHELSPRHRQPFVVVNCGAIPEALFEAELFGFERGAFTGALQSRIGKIQAARGGTLFLDEVGELPPAMQAKLLRFLQEREVQRLGSTESTRVDVRVIAATNAALRRLCAEGAFRSDLYYRLNVFPIALPPLRHRREDILILARHFLNRLCRESSSPAKWFSEAAVAAMKAFAWPGNVRELEHVIERAFIFSETSREVHVELPSEENSDDAPGALCGGIAAGERLPPARLTELGPPRQTATAARESAG